MAPTRWPPSRNWRSAAARASTGPISFPTCGRSSTRTAQCPRWSRPAKTSPGCAARWCTRKQPKAWCTWKPAIEPQLYSELGSFKDVTDTILKAFAEAASDAGIDVGATLTINTDSDEEIAVELASVAASLAGRGVTALGTAGFVEPAGLHRYTAAADKVRAAGLPIVSHAGQTGGPDSVLEAIEVLGASRLSHGFRSVESPELVAQLAAERICCDVCPVSNVALGVVDDLAAHPAPALLSASVPVTLNADDQLWFGVSITGQYEIARDVWGLDDHILAEFARSGMNARGMSTSTKTRMATAIDAWLQEEPR